MKVDEYTIQTDSFGFTVHDMGSDSTRGPQARWRASLCLPNLGKSLRAESEESLLFKLEMELHELRQKIWKRREEVAMKCEAPDPKSCLRHGERPKCSWEKNQQWVKGEPDDS